MRKHVILYGLLGGVLIAGLKLHRVPLAGGGASVEIYGGLVAAVFAGSASGSACRLTRRVETVVVREVPVPAPADFVRDQAQLEALGITPRELEILELIAAGLSNKEIAARVYRQREHGQDALEPACSTSSAPADGPRRCSWARSCG